MINHGFPIAIAAQRAGLTQHVIRAWEKRYGAIQPARSGTKRRLYTDEEIERLQLLRQATHSGHSIGNIATLPTESLRSLAAEKLPAQSPAPPPDSAASFLARSVEAVRALDCVALEGVLQNGIVALGRGLLTIGVIIPLVRLIGEEWERGTMRIVHEHCATAVIRTLLGDFVHSHSATVNAPVLLVTTPPGQLHELGALIVAATATDRGWRVIYLGPGLPPEEIAVAFRQWKADALALSIVYPADDPLLAAQLRMIRRLLPDAPIISGGSAAAAYQAALREIRSIVCDDISSTTRVLEEIRARRVSP